MQKNLQTWGSLHLSLCSLLFSFSCKTLGPLKDGQPVGSLSGERQPLASGEKDFVLAVGEKSSSASDSETTGMRLYTAIAAKKSLIVYHKFITAKSQIFVMDPDTLQETALTKGDFVDLDPGLSWDGKKVVFTREVAPFTNKIVLVDSKGGKLSALVPELKNVLYGQP